jgi:hypothetical protein
MAQAAIKIQDDLEQLRRRFDEFRSTQPLRFGERYYAYRKNVMAFRREGLTATYNRFHNPQEAAEDIRKLRALHVEMDNFVAAAYGWTDLDLGHGFHQTKQGIRYTISEPARREVLDRLLALNHARHAAEGATVLVRKPARKLARSANKEKTR